LPLDRPQPFLFQPWLIFFFSTLERGRFVLAAHHPPSDVVDLFFLQQYFRPLPDLTLRFFTFFFTFMVFFLTSLNCSVFSGLLCLTRFCPLSP